MAGPVRTMRTMCPMNCHPTLCGAFAAKAHITERIPAGVVWMRDGCVGLNQVSSGAPVLPEKALGLFHFTAGQAEYEAMVEVAAALPPLGPTTTRQAQTQIRGDPA